MEIVLEQENVAKAKVTKNDKLNIDFQIALPFYLCALLTVGMVCLSVLSTNAAKKNGIIVQSTTQINYPL